MNGRSSIVLGVSSAMIAASTIFVFSRLLSRFAIVKKVQIDDYFITAAWLFAFGLSFSICYGVKYGLGEHQENISEASLASLIKLEYTFSVLYNPALMATKTSICAFYLTLSTARPVFRWTTIATLVIVNGAGIALTFLNIFQCNPVTNTFVLPRPDSTVCYDIITLYLSSAPVNIITDLMLVLLPLPVLKGMNVPRKQKIILYVTFGFGVFVTAVDIVRIAYLQDATLHHLQHIKDHQNTSKLDTQTSTDFSWYASLSFMWSAIEVNVGIMCSCVPALKPIFSRFLPRFIRDVGEESVQKSRESSQVPNTPISPHDAYSPTLEDNDSSDGPMNINEFLTTPDMTDVPNIGRTDTVQTTASGLTRRRTRKLSFIDMDEQKSIVYMTNKESVKPVALVTILFFIWGCSYGLLSTLNTQFEVVAKLSASQSVGLHSAYYVGYFVAPLTFGRQTLKRFGFKACYMVGLVVYGTGTLVFWPSAVLNSFWAFLISNFIVGLGLSTLEIAANPFTALCGPLEHAELRLNLSQAFQACGTVLSPLLAQKVLFGNTRDASSLVDTQWAYLAISLFTYILAFVYYCIKLPEVTDVDLEESALENYGHGQLSYLRTSHIMAITLALSVIAQFAYVGAQEAVSTTLTAYYDEVLPNVNRPYNFEAYGHTTFAISRFLAAGCNLFIKSRHQLLFYLFGSIIFSILAMNFDGWTSAAMVLCVYFFEGPLFSFIYALPLRGLGKHTKDGATLLTAAISGGAVFSPIQHAIGTSHGYRYSYCVVVASFATATILGVYLNAVPAAKKQVDPIKKPELTIDNVNQTATAQQQEMAHPFRTNTIGSLKYLLRRHGTRTDTDELAVSDP